jgi:hypothetical protein
MRARGGLGGAIATLALLTIGNRVEAQAADWQRSIQIGANAWYGAARTRVVATDLELSRMDSAVTLRSDFHLGYADSRQGDAPRQVTARAMRASLGVDYRPFARYSPFGFGSIESILQQRIAQRSNVGIGAKLTFWRKGKEDLSVSLALLAERTRALLTGDIAGDATGRSRWSVRFRYRRQMTSSVSFSHVTFYQPVVGAVGQRYIVDAVTAAEAAITSVLLLTGTVKHRYDSEARERGAVSNTDGQMLFGVRARF